MTVDMLTAAFIWPEEVLIGRPHLGDERDRDAPAAPARSPDPARAEAPALWSALLRRFGTEARRPHVELG